MTYDLSRTATCAGYRYSVMGRCGHLLRNSSRILQSTSHPLVHRGAIGWKVVLFSQHGVHVLAPKQQVGWEEASLQSLAVALPFPCFENNAPPRQMRP
jgi:hypothetical protein